MCLDIRLVEGEVANEEGYDHDGHPHLRMPDTQRHLALFGYAAEAS